MIAKIEVYNDNGDLVSAGTVPAYQRWIDYDNVYEICKYEFRFLYADCKIYQNKEKSKEEISNVE